MTPIESSEITKRIATALLTTNEFSGNLTAADVEVLLAEIIAVVITKIAPTRGATRADVEVGVRIEEEKLHVDAIIHITFPITPKFLLVYTLINEQDNIRRLQLEEPAGVHADGWLANKIIQAMNIPSLIEEQIKDPAALVSGTLPELLEKHKLPIADSNVELQLHGNLLALRLRIKRE